MTLVLSVSTPAFAIHVSDRLVSKGGAPHDPVANKSVVLRATDGLLVFGYTGPAFLDGMPTDTWIANVASGGVANDLAGSVAFGRFPVKDVGSTLLRLSDQLGAQRIFAQFGGVLSAAGWQWNQRRANTFARPVLWVRQGSAGAGRWSQLMPRHLPDREQQFRMFPIGDWALPHEAWGELVESVGRAGPDLDAVEFMLVEAVRAASHVRPGTIGSHCMSVVLRRPGQPHADMRFVPAEPHLGEAFDQSVQVAFSPWMIAPDAIHAPSISVGGLESEQGLLSFVIRAPTVPDTQVLKGAFQSQARPRS